MSSSLTAAALYSVNMASLPGGAAKGAEVAVYDAQRTPALVLGAGGVDFLNAATGIGGGTIANPGADWRVAALGDVNADGRADIIWQHDSGAASIWTMDGRTPVAAQGYATPSADWTLAGAADFDGDGKDDLLWRNSADGQAAIWQMDGLTVLSGQTIADPGLGWNLRGVGDYDGDGRADILWRAQAGDLVLWEMDGFLPTTILPLGTVGPEWSLMAKGATTQVGGGTLGSP